MSESVSHGRLEFTENDLPVFVDELVHVVAQSFVVKEILEVEIHSRSVEDHLEFIAGNLNVNFSVPFFDHVRAEFHLNVDVFL